MSVEALSPFANLVQDIHGKKFAAIIDPFGKKAIDAASKTRKQAAIANAARKNANGSDVASQLRVAEPEPITPVSEQKQTIVDERGRRRRIVSQGKQSTILSGTNTRLKQRLGQ